MVKILDPKTVNFETNGGSRVASQTVYRDFPVKRPSNPVRSGYTFDAWYSDNEAFVNKWNFDTVPNADITLYANWNFSGGYTADTAGLDFVLINNNTAYRVSRGTAEGNIVIPAYHRPNAESPALPVTEIGNGTNTSASNAFGGTSPSSPNNTVTSITFAAGSQLTTISSYAFYNCSSLTSITIPANVTDIGSSAFSGCNNLTDITIDNDKAVKYNGTAFNSNINWGSIFPASGTNDLSVTFKKNVVEDAFNSAGSNQNYRLTSVTIAEGVTSIGARAFADSTRLASITIPATVMTIGEHAFFTCTGLTSITIPAGVTSIAANAFAGCTNLKNITIDNAVYPTDTSSNWGTIFPANDLSVTFMKNVRGAAFYACYRLTSVTIAEGVTHIGGSAFQSTSITSISIPASVASIDGAAFDNCASLARVTFAGTISSSTGWTVSSANAFLGDLRAVFFANSANGLPGTYTTTAPVSASSVWTKQP
jgi:uncharacterized repeat protein (TIGR02543 family)